MYAGEEVLPDAHVYLGYLGSELSREDAIEAWKEGANTYKIYVGSGFVKYEVIVITSEHSSVAADSGDEALEIAEEFLREHRPEEIEDEDDNERDDWDSAIEDITYG